MSLESSELHKQVFGESDDDDLSDLGEVDFSEDEDQNRESPQASSPESVVEDSPKRLKIRLPKFKKRTDTSRNADPDYSETQRPRPKKRRRRFDEIITEDDEIVKVEREEKLTPYEEIKRRVDKDFDEALKASSGRRRKRKDVDLEATRDDEAQELYALMIAAADRDIALNNQRKPAVKKLERVEYVTWVLKKANMLDTLLENNILESIRAWLEPLPDASLPNIAIQRGLFEVLERVPMSIDLLRQSGIGKIVHFYEEHPRNDADITRRAAKLVAKWSAPIFGKSLDYRDKKIVYYRPETGEMPNADGTVTFAPSSQRRPVRKRGPDPYKNLKSRMAQMKKGINVK
ncbi:8086_t:CDS:2 [Paraglomus occultum]|uniref:8086_t:CDS:1 n=1 Tax=Paraglomus occultum TaxID=144539 RepID=A0A9N9AWA3_9GLOM|nr:8086_t:CDS:2 [Paraglomus occultum]